MAIKWKEDVRLWHPGQEWLWEPGGLGVFDPGINALSIATAILANPFFLTRARIDYPENRGNPIAASLVFADADATPITAELDWRQIGPQIWTIDVETDAGTLLLADGASSLSIDGDVVIDEDDDEAEYRGLYTRFGQLLTNGASDVDAAPRLAEIPSADDCLVASRDGQRPAR